MNRAMRRKAQREKRPIPPGPVSTWTLQQISQVTGCRVDTLIEWLEARSQELAQDMGEQMAEMMYEGEGYIASVNILITLYAMKLTFGDLKTLKKRMGQFLENLGPALDHIYKDGPKTVYEGLTSEYGLDGLEFEDFDIERLFEHGERAKFAAARIIEKSGGKKEEKQDET